MSTAEEKEGVQGLGSTFNERLRRVAADVGYLQKDKVNKHHGYGYASAENVLRQVSAALVRHGLVVSCTSYEIVEREGPLVTVRVMSEISATDIPGIATFTGLGSGKDNQDKAVMKALTAAQKYMWAGALQISWGDDPEATDPETGESTATARPRKKAPKQRNAMKRPAETKATDASAPLVARCKEATALDQLKAIFTEAKSLESGDRQAVKAAYNEARTRIKSASSAEEGN